MCIRDSNNACIGKFNSTSINGHGDKKVDTTHLSCGTNIFNNSNSNFSPTFNKTALKFKTMNTVKVFVLLLFVAPVFSLKLAIAQTSTDYPSSYKSSQPGESEFDNYNDGFVSYWQNADEEYQDTVFGEQIYNETSTPTKLEMLRLLSKETPPTVVFLHALSMGLAVDEMLLASLEYQEDNARGLASSAVSLLPYLQNRNVYEYPTYNLDSLELYIKGLEEQRNKGSVDPGKEHIPYLVQEVIDNFFEEGLVLAPYPDWLDGQMHFIASAEELLGLSRQNKTFWYQSNNTQSVEDRPIFVSLYKHNKSVLVDGIKRIEDAINQKKSVQDPVDIPVVFIFNRENERSVSSLGYPVTLQGVQDAYIEKNLMLTPVPEWNTGEYHALIDIDEFYAKFDIPQEKDFEPQAWQRLLDDARNYDVNETSLLVIVLNQANHERTKQQNSSTKLNIDNSVLLAAWDDPRTESQFLYTPPKRYNSDGDEVLNVSEYTIDSIVGQGLVLNRPDLVAALKALGVRKVPVAFYYFDDERVKPYFRGPRSLIQAAIGADTPKVVLPNGGFLTPVEELPPVDDLPPASPPGLP